MQRREAELRALGAAVVVVSFEPPTAYRAFAALLHLPYPVYGDRRRTAYRAFGLTRAPKWRLYTLGALRAYLVGLFRGHLPTRPKADVAQLGGDFVLDAEGRIVYAHPSRDPSDRPPAEHLIAAVRAGAAPVR